MNNMKRIPFIEIMDFKKEIKEYKLLCQGKSKKFTYYLDWKKYIISLLAKIERKDDLENFKYYCRNRERSTKNTASTYLNIIILFITIYLGNCVASINLYGWLLVFVLIIVTIVWQNNSFEKDYYFYRDILEIIELEEKIE